MTGIILDNGIVFDPEEAIVKKSPRGGMGLLSIKERTEHSGGLFGVESGNGKGTIVRASWLLSGNNFYAKPPAMPGRIRKAMP